MVSSRAGDQLFTAEIQNLVRSRLSAHEYPRRIDYVFVRGPDKKVRGKPLAARVVMEEIEGGVCASDHYGVYAEVSI